MRVSTNQTQHMAVNAMSDQSEKLAVIQQKVSSGLRINKPSDDPVAASKMINLDNLLHVNEQQQMNINAATARMSLEEGILANAGDVLQRVRELTVAANNGSQTNETRGFISEEVDQLLQELLGLANTVDSNGEYIFAGSKTHVKPFLRNEAGEILYYGDDTQRFIQIGPRRTIAESDTGTSVFRDIREGNGTFVAQEGATNTGTGVIDPGNVSGRYDQGTYTIEFSKKESLDPYEPLTFHVVDDKGNYLIPPGTPFQEDQAIEVGGVVTSLKGTPAPGDYFVISPSRRKDVFTMLGELRDVLATSYSKPADTARLNNAVNRAITGIDQSLGKILDTRASVGARLNALDSQSHINETYNLQIKGVLSDIRDLDYGQAMSELSTRMATLEASQKSFARVQGLSLFNHI